jgi:RNA polymerase sigma-70 factor (ECF subfamily)
MTIQELEQCIALYGKDIYSFCRHLTKGKESADDLYQDTFLEAMKKITAIRYGENPKSYDKRRSAHPCDRDAVRMQRSD